MLGLFEGGLFPGVAYYLSWYVVLPPSLARLLVYTWLIQCIIAGTNVQNLDSDLRFSSRQEQYSHPHTFAYYCIMLNTRLKIGQRYVFDLSRYPYQTNLRLMPHISSISRRFRWPTCGNYLSPTLTIVTSIYRKLNKSYYPRLLSPTWQE